MESVDVGELERNTRDLLARVEGTGSNIEITRGGRPVARLVPIEVGTGRCREQLIAVGVLRPGRGNPLDVVPVTLPTGSSDSIHMLSDLREDRR